MLERDYVRTWQRSWRPTDSRVSRFDQGKIFSRSWLEAERHTN